MAYFLADDKDFFTKICYTNRPLKIQATMTESLLPTQFILYGNGYYDSHIVLLLLEEKRLDYTFVPTLNNSELAQLNPYKTLPILVGREISLYEFMVIFEYLEERHQAHKLLPATPKERATVRTLAWRIQKDWLTLGKILMTHPDSLDEAAAQNAKKSLSDILITLSPLFAQKPFFLSDNFGLCDVLLLPFLWHLPNFEVNLPTHLCRSLLDYQARLSQRPSFINTLNHLKKVDF